MNGRRDPQSIVLTSEACSTRDEVKIRDIDAFEPIYRVIDGDPLNSAGRSHGNAGLWLRASASPRTEAFDLVREATDDSRAVSTLDWSLQLLSN